MKCDYCKIHYEENEGVCPNCGRTPRKRWAKILCAVAEVVFWMYWIMMIPVAWGEARIGHPVIGTCEEIKYFTDQKDRFVYWAEVTMSYRVKDGKGNLTSKKQTYIIKWNATNDNYEWHGAKKE